MQENTNQSASSPPGGRSGSNGDTPESPVDAFRDIGERFAELKEFASYYWSAKTDSIKVSIRNAGLFAAIGIVGLIAVGALVVMAVALVCLGIAYGLTALFGGMAWLGYLVTGVLLLAVLGATVFFGMRYVTRSSRKRTADKYEKLQYQQKLEFGTTVHEQAANAHK